jgi:hypothetical protein
MAAEMKPTLKEFLDDFVRQCLEREAWPVVALLTPLDGEYDVFAAHELTPEETIGLLQTAAEVVWRDHPELAERLERGRA